MKTWLKMCELGNLLYVIIVMLILELYQFALILYL